MGGGAACIRAGGEGGASRCGLSLHLLSDFDILGMFILKKAKKRGHFCEELLDPKRFLLAGEERGSRGRIHLVEKKLVSIWFRQKPKKKKPKTFPPLCRLLGDRRSPVLCELGELQLAIRHPAGTQPCGDSRSHMPGSSGWSLGPPVPFPVDQPRLSLSTTLVQL